MNFSLLSTTSLLTRASLLALASSVLLLVTVACGGNETPGHNDGSGDEIELTITSPEANSYQTRTRLLIEGTVEGTSSVTVEGRTATVESDGQWEIYIDFEEDGPATVTAVAGTAEESVDFVIDTMVPKVVIESPQRGTVVDADVDGEEIEVTGTVTDVGPSGLVFVEVNGQPMDTEDGHFEGTVMVEPGLNFITARAVDFASNQNQISHALIYGPLTDATEAIDKAARVDIDNPSGIDAITDVIEAYITPEQINAFIEEGFEDEGFPVTITNIDWDELHIDITPTDGILELELQMTDLLIEGEFGSDEDEEPDSGYIAIAEVNVALDIELSADADSQLDVVVVDDEITLEEVTVDVGGESPGWLETAVEIAIGLAFEQFLSGLVEDNLYDPDILTQQIEFMGRSIEITLLLQDIIVSPLGISAELGIEFPGDRHPSVPDVAGALHRPVGAPLGSSVNRPLLFHSTRTALDRVLHSVWRSGLFHQRLGNDDLSGIQLPFNLTADGLGTLLDSKIRDIHETDTPAELRLRPLLAPVVEFGQDDQATVRVGDFLVDIFLLPEDSNQETLILTLALHLDVVVELEVNDSEIGFDIDIEAEGDVVDEPVIDFDQDAVVNLITDLIEVAPDLAASDLSIDSEGSFEWATISDPAITMHGEDLDLLTLGVELSAAQDFIEDDNVDVD